MLYSFVNSQGMIVGQKKEFDIPPVLHSSKGRWLLDISPAYDRELYTLQTVQPVPADALAVPYELALVGVTEAQGVGIQRINQARIQRLTSGFDFNGKPFDTDHSSVVNILGAAVAAIISHTQGVPFSVTWTCADNTTMELTGPLMMQLMISLVQHVDSQYALARTQKSSVNEASAATVEAVINSIS